MASATHARHSPPRLPQVQVLALANTDTQPPRDHIGAATTRTPPPPEPGVVDGTAKGRRCARSSRHGVAVALVCPISEPSLGRRGIYHCVHFPLGLSLALRHVPADLVRAGQRARADTARGQPCVSAMRLVRIRCGAFR